MFINLILNLRHDSTHVFKRWACITNIYLNSKTRIEIINNIMCPWYRYLHSESWEFRLTPTQKLEWTWPHSQNTHHENLRRGNRGRDLFLSKPSSSSPPHADVSQSLSRDCPHASKDTCSANVWEFCDWLPLLLMIPFYTYICYNKLFGRCSGIVGTLVRLERVNDIAMVKLITRARPNMIVIDQTLHALTIHFRNINWKTRFLPRFQSWLWLQF